MRPDFEFRFRRLLLVSSMLLVALALTAPASAVPTTVTSQNVATCDPLSVPFNVDELGSIAPFPADESIASGAQVAQFLPACVPTDNVAIIDEIVDIVNLTGRTFDNVWYVADPETTITNVDGLVNGEAAFRIDALGINTPLIAEIGGVLPGIFEPGELWSFVLQDYSNTLGISPSFLGSFGVPSPGTSPVIGGPSSSSGSIITPEPSTLLLAGLGLAGIALLARRRPKA